MKNKFLSILLITILFFGLVGCRKNSTLNNKEKDSISNNSTKENLSVSYTQQTLHYEICDKNQKCQKDSAGIEADLMDHYNIDFDFIVGLQEKDNSNFKYYIDITFSVLEKTEDISAVKKKYYEKTINLVENNITDIKDNLKIRIKDNLKIDYSSYYNEIIEYLNNNGINKSDVTINCSVFLTIENSNSKHCILSVIDMVSKIYDGLSDKMMTGFYLLYPNGQMIVYNQNQSDKCNEEIISWVRECQGCVNPKMVAIYKNRCSSQKYYYDKYGNKHKYGIYGDGSGDIDWLLIN